MLWKCQHLSNFCEKGQLFVLLQESELQYLPKVMFYWGEISKVNSNAFQAYRTFKKDSFYLQ